MYQSFSLKWLFVIVVMLFEIGSLICGVAPDSTTFIVGRAIAGLGAGITLVSRDVNIYTGGIFAGALTIIAYSVPLRKRPIFAGAIGAMFGVSTKTEARVLIIRLPVLQDLFSEDFSPTISLGDGVSTSICRSAL